MYNDRDDLNDNMDQDTDLDTRGATNEGKGGMRKMGGKIEEAAGKVTGKDDWEAEGKMKQAEGDIQQGWGKAERKTDDVLDS